MLLRVFAYYLIGLNALTFILYGLDKWKSRHGRWRIPEAVLMWLAVLGGAPAVLIAMTLFRHKTQHNKFRIGVPIILVVQIAVTIYLFSTGYKL